MASFIEAPTVLRAYDAGGILRQLLLDKQPLVDVVNRNRVRLRFKVNVFPPEIFQEMAEQHTIAILGPGLSPAHSSFGVGTVLLSRDKFFAQPVVQTAWHRVTVKNIMSWSANKAGGIHFDVKGDDTTDLFNRFMRTGETEEASAFGSTMVAISEIVLAACQPVLRMS
ncbi:MAG TPA: hypothetical protein VK629_09055 [Steroidobacteraceae bacterium]|nr:hypothetical protein [Steroidobacteraceae bacterium]